MRAMGAGSRAAALATSLSHASRILPIVTTAHLPSAACDAYWPEVYWNQPIVDEPRPNPYGDTPSPKTFTHVSPLDPQLFSTMHEHAEELLLSQERSGQYSPLEVATWLEDLASAVSQQHSIAGPPLAPADRRVIVDTRIQAGLGRFFAAKFRAGLVRVSTRKRAIVGRSKRPSRTTDGRVRRGRSWSRTRACTLRTSPPATGFPNGDNGAIALRRSTTTSR